MLQQSGASQLHKPAESQQAEGMGGGGVVQTD